MFILDIGFHPPNLPIHKPPIPKALPEVPAEARNTIEEAKFEEVADVEEVII